MTKEELNKQPLVQALLKAEHEFGLRLYRTKHKLPIELEILVRDLQEAANALKVSSFPKRET